MKSCVVESAGRETSQLLDHRYWREVAERIYDQEGRAEITEELSQDADRSPVPPLIMPHAVSARSP